MSDAKWKVYEAVQERLQRVSYIKAYMNFEPTISEVELFESSAEETDPDKEKDFLRFCGLNALHIH